MAWKEFYINKRNGGKRLIISPDEETKEKQREILKELYKIYYPFSDFYYAFGGLLFKNIKQLADKHVGKSIVVRLDINDFFDNIDRDILLTELDKDFKKKKVKNSNALLNKIEKYCFYRDKIPQGAITSPFLSNIYLKSFDRVVSVIARLGHYSYSRYFDDLTFSFNSKEIIMDALEDKNTTKPLQIIHIIKIVQSYLEKIKLELNYDKTKIMKKNKRQSVCNLTVNEKVNINRKYYRWLRAIKHHFDTGKETTIGKEQYLGHLAFVHSINPKIVEKLMMKGGEKWEKQ